MTNSIGDLAETDCFLITGSNTTENHPVISTIIKQAVSQRGAKLILADPRRIDLARFATIWLRQKPGTDVAWLNGMMHVIIKEDLCDKTFIEERTEKFEEMKAVVEKYTPEHVESITGIPAGQIIDAARLYARAPAGSILYCMGITQHTTGVDNVKSLANLAMLCGNMGIRGGGVNPLRGQNNVQGACDMGGLPNVLTGYQTVDNLDAIKKMEDAWGVTGLSTQVGLKATEMIPKAREAAQRALELDSSQGEAYGVLGAIALYFDWDWEAARREFELALGLDPTDSAEDGDDAIQHPQAALHLDGEVNMARGVYNIDLMIIPGAGCCCRGDRYPSFLLLFHPVHDSCTLMDLAHLIRATGVI